MHGGVGSNGLRYDAIEFGHLYVQLSDKREEIRTELYDYIEVAIEIKRSMKKIMRRRLVHSTRRGVTLFPETPLQSPLVASSPHPGAFNCRDLRRNVASYRN